MKKRSFLPLFYAALPLLAAGAAEPLRWAPLAGNWQQENGALFEYSDGVDDGNQPLWAVAAPPVQTAGFAVDATAQDGVGDLYLAIHWQNRRNYYALRYSDPHRKLELLQVRNGRETVLAETENAGDASPQKAPLRLSLRLDGDQLTGTAGATELTARVGVALPPGSVAVGTRYRKGRFANTAPLTGKEQTAPATQLELTSWRTVYRADETDVTIPVACPGEVPDGAELVFRFDPALPPVRVAAPRSGKTAELPFPANALTPGDYPATLELTADGKTIARRDFVLTVAPQPLPGRFELILWDGIDNGGELARLGFTASSAPFFFTSKFVEAPERHTAEVRDAVRRADQNLRYGVNSLIKVDTRRYWDKNKYGELLVVGADGKPQLSGEICHNHPEYRRLLAESLQALGNAVADAQSPAYLLFDSETENEERKLYRCFHPSCLEQQRQAGFLDVPKHLDRVWGMVGVSLGKIGENAPGRVLPDGAPEAAILRWWWLKGSGFVESRRAAAGQLKAKLPKTLTFHDPILRNPPYHGRAEGLDFVSHWTYTNPSPLALLENIDEMRAAADGKPVVPNIQLFWYTNEVVGKLDSAEANAKLAAEANAVAEARDAIHFGRFVTVSPDHLREALWLSLSRPVQSIMLDGGSAVSDTPGTYAATNPATAEVIAQFSDQVLKPYGAMIRSFDRAPGEVAMLQSAFSTLYGRTGNFGNANKRFADAYNSVALAQLEPELLYDEDSAKLANYRVLIIADTEVLPQSVFDAIRSFQASGKPVLLDAKSKLELPGAIRVDFPDTAKLDPAAQQLAWENAGAALKTKLRELGYQPPVTSPEHNVVLGRRLGAAGDQLLVVVNDARRAGNYVGQFGKVLEAGVPQNITLDFSPELTAGGRVWYDLQTRRPLAGVRTVAHLDAGGGRLFYLAASELTGLTANVAPKTARPGDQVTLEVALTARGALNGTQSVELTLLDPDGRRDPRSGGYALTDGKLKLELTIPRNAKPGHWQLRLHDQIAGFSTEPSFEVTAR